LNGPLGLAASWKAAPRSWRPIEHQAKSKRRIKIKSMIKNAGAHFQPGFLVTESTDYLQGARDFVPVSGGIATLNPRLLSRIPAGCRRGKKPKALPYSAVSRRPWGHTLTIYNRSPSSRGISQTRASPDASPSSTPLAQFSSILNCSCLPSLAYIKAYV
jgi:hypothetical protein